MLILALDMSLPVPSEQTHLTHPKYRTDIDGLRAIAVLSVVGFHAFPFWVKGGFVGVDIFFVISGFLISSIIFSSLERNCFSFVEFYSRRIRRIFPALILVMATCFVFGWFALLADEYKQLGKHIAGGAAFVSNFVLWNESGYFDNAAETKPLLHLWSLGIEEQYYIAWPLLLWLAWKKRFNLLFITIIVAVISFWLNIASVRSNTVAAFYSPQTRFWELLGGSVLAYMALHKQNIFPKLKHKIDMLLCQMAYAQLPETNGKILCNVQSVFGAILIAIGVFVITKEMHFPGWWAVLPTLGAALVISAGAHAWLNRVVLSNRVLVWFGLISFPLYLWHWPLLAFARIVESGIPSRPIRIVAVLISITLAWITYRLIEKPVRFGKHGNEKVLFLFALMAVIGYAGYKTYEHNGLPLRIAAKPVVRYEGGVGREMYLDYMNNNYHRCSNIHFRELSAKDEYDYRCFQSKPDQEIDMVIIGDSHADHLLHGLASTLKSINVVSFMQIGLPTIDNKYFSEAFLFIIHNKNIKTVVLSAQWKTKITARDDTTKLELSKTLTTLINENKRVYVIDDIPSYSFNPNRCKYQRLFSLSENLCTQPLHEHKAQSNMYSKFLSEIVASVKNAHYIPVDQYFCDASKCSMVNDKDILYRDEHHLSITGSNYLGNKIYPIFTELPYLKSE